MINPKQLISAYKLGIFPMAEGRKNKKLFFLDPEVRAIIPIQEFNFSKNFIRLLKKRPFEISMNKAFNEVIRSCATVNRSDTWINKDIENLFIALNEMKYAHSVECWKNGKLIGGVYGLAIGGIFFAESMFSSVSNGSKVALLNLIARLWKTGFRMLDVQFLNDHLIQFGAYEISKNKFKRDLNKVIKLKVDIYSLGLTDDDFFECLSSFLHARIDTS